MNQHPADVRLEFDNDLEAPSRARRALRTLLAPDDSISSDVELAVSELVTNVVVHTSDGGVLQAWDPKPGVPFRLEVEDRSTETAASPNPPCDVGGYGLQIVAAVSDAWGVVPTRRGTRVWCEFDRSVRPGWPAPTSGTPTA